MGIRTARNESQRRLRSDHPNHAFAEDYQPTPSGVLNDLMISLPLDPQTHVFVDLGAGKGRVLCLAAAYPFARIVGVELVPALAAACRENIAAFAAPWIRCSTLECVQADAASFRLPNAPLVVYMFNPFKAPVLKRVLRNLRDSFAIAPRSIWVIYYMPVHRHHFDHDPVFTVVEEQRDWVVYRMTPHKT